LFRYVGERESLDDDLGCPVCRISLESASTACRHTLYHWMELNEDVESVPLTLREGGQLEARCWNCQNVRLMMRVGSDSQPPFVDLPFSGLPHHFAHLVPPGNPVLVHYYRPTASTHGTASESLHVWAGDGENLLGDAFDGPAEWLVTPDGFQERRDPRLFHGSLADAIRHPEARFGHNSADSGSEDRESEDRESEDRESEEGESE
jgi:hypothetical protein